MAKKKIKAATADKRSKARQPKRSQGHRFPVIGLGASAGGLEALKAFFSRVPEKCGMAYIVVVHMTPTQPSLMSELLQKVTPIPVTPAQDGQIIAPDHIYVIPPNKEIRVFKGVLQLMEVLEKHVALPIDTFLKSLALDCGARSGAIILSGTGTDGTLGIKEIKANDGLVLVQSETSAAYDGMPHSAISTGVVDMVLEAGDMPDKLCHYFGGRLFVSGPEPAMSAASDPQTWLNNIFALLRARLGHDFSDYKINTIVRRVNRRMGLNQIDSHALYVRFLRENPNEVDALFRELLIGVTSFFRDPDSFEIFIKDILPGIFEQIKDDGILRVWVPGCSTGEEVYSLAMVMRERLESDAKRVRLQLFGTDINNRAIDKARAGLYPASISADVGQKRLKRFFIREGAFYRVCKEIRDCAVFSVQDILKDPPFSKLNLLCCRNLMIYLDSHAQKKMMPLFHYTLAPQGVLMLGSSETIGGFSNLFLTLDRKWKIFKRKEVPIAMRQPVTFPSGLTATKSMHADMPLAPGLSKADIGQIARQAILNQLSPTAILIDGHGNLLHIQGRTGRYLEPPSGPPTHNILDLARPGLRIELSSAVRAAKTTNRAVTRKNISIKTNGRRQMIELQVRPQHTPKELAGSLLVVFENVAPPSDDTSPIDGVNPEASALHHIDSRTAELEHELQSARESHQTTVEELETTNEELKSTNEELQSANEELQSTNEEMESSKEELQSLNEELQTVNAELQSKVDELSATQNDMHNLLNSTGLATIFVDNQLCIKRFTKEATAIVNLIPSDMGRPLEHVATNLDYQGLMADLKAVAENLTPRQMEVQTQAGSWYNMRIVPYRTADNHIDGAVLTFSAISDQKNVQQAIENARFEMEGAWQLVRHVFDMDTSPMAVLDKEACLVIANTAFCKLLGIDSDHLAGQNLFKLDNHVLNQTDLKKKLKLAFNTGAKFQTADFQIAVAGDPKTYVIVGEVIAHPKNEPYRILLKCLEQR